MLNNTRIIKEYYAVYLENKSTNSSSKHLHYDILEYKKCRLKSVGEEGKGTSLNTVYAI